LGVLGQEPARRRGNLHTSPEQEAIVGDLGQQCREPARTVEQTRLEARPEA
jgi:hypothetical protein